jgi:glyoxylase-like metal-dependent hydrolase (beta-lactamase superfamily II)
VTTERVSSIGRPGDPSAVRSLQLDDVVATYVVDGVVLIRPRAFFPAIPPDYWAARPELLTTDGIMPMSTGGLLIEREGKTLLIDAGVGTATVQFAAGDVDCGAMLDVFESIGRRPSDVDVVAFTHLHFDHAGWAFTNGVKTFRDARYVLSAQEWAPYADGAKRGGDKTTPWHVILQLACDTDSVDLIDDGDEILPGVRALVTPGHTPGHTSFVITSSSGQRLVVLGDAFHTTAQLAHPEWMSAAESDAAAVPGARRRLLAELAEPNTVGFGFHFGDQCFGRVRPGHRGEAAWEPIPTSVLAPPPR